MRLIVALLVFLFFRLPTSFLPTEDQGFAQLQFTLPPGATQARTLAAAKAIEHYFLAPGRRRTSRAMFTVVGGNQAGSRPECRPRLPRAHALGPAQGHARTAPRRSRARATRDARRQLRDVEFYALNPPPVRGLGQSAGFTMELLNTRRPAARAISRRRATSCSPRRAPIRAGRGAAEHARGQSDARRSTMDQAKIGALGPHPGRRQHDAERPPGAATTSTISSTAAGSSASTSRATRPIRAAPEDLDQLVRPHLDRHDGALLRLRHDQLGRRRRRRSAASTASPSYEFQGQAAPGKSSGDAMDTMAELAAQSPGRLGRTGAGCPTRNGCPAARRPISTRSRCSSSSSASPRSTKAGRSRSRCCWSSRSAWSARSSR